jgi:pimeloyl-ACP methyl ester carboxylesterase
VSDLDAVVTRMITPARNPPRESRVRWPHRETLDFRSGPVAYWTAGDGPPVLLVHGWSTTHADLDAFVAPLLARGFGAVARRPPYPIARMPFVRSASAWGRWPARSDTPPVARPRPWPSSAACGPAASR